MYSAEHSCLYFALYMEEKIIKVIKQLQLKSFPNIYSKAGL